MLASTNTLRWRMHARVPAFTSSICRRACLFSWESVKAATLFLFLDSILAPNEVIQIPRHAGARISLHPAAGPPQLLPPRLTL
jgi:hypothetical protein